MLYAVWGAVRTPLLTRFFTNRAAELKYCPTASHSTSALVCTPEKAVLLPAGAETAALGGERKAVHACHDSDPDTFYCAGASGLSSCAPCYSMYLLQYITPTNT